MGNNTEPAKRASREFTPLSFVWRMLFALILVLSTYNPTDYSYYRWIRSVITDGNLGPEHFFVGVIILIGWTILLIASYRSLGRFGLFLGAAFFGTFIWLLTDLGLLEAESFSAITWIALVCLAGLLAVGLSWSHVWRRLTGQFEVDDVDS